MAAPTREQLQANIKAMESQGAPPADIQAYLDSFKGQTPGPAQTTSASAAAPVSRGTPASGAPEPDTFLETLVKDPLKTLLVKPAARTTEALGRLGVFGKEAKEGYEIMADEGQAQDLKTPIGRYQVEPVKTGTKAVGQIAGEALKAGSYLYGGQGAASAGKSLFGKAAGTAVATGAKAGAASGAMYGGGQALEEGKDAGGVAAGAAGGAVIGGIAGAAIPMAIQGVSNLGKKAVSTAASVPGRVAGAVERANAPEVVKKALSSGVDENVVNFIREAAPEDKVSFKKMFDIAEKGSKDLRFRDQPRQVAGSEILDRVSHIIKVKDLGVGATNRALNSLDNSPVDVSNVLFNFLSDMQEKGITVVKRGNGYQMVTHGNVPEGDLGAYQMMLKLIAPENGKVARSYRGLHTARQRVFNELNLAKARQQTFSDDVTRYADKFRTMLLEPIDKASKGKYKAAQQKTAEALGSLREFVQLMGYKGDLEKLTTKDLKVAEVASRVLGNASDRPMSVLQNIDDVAAKYGYKAKGSWIDQLQFADLLEDVFGTKQTRSLRGQVGRGTLDAVSEATGAAHDVATGNVLSLGSRTVKAILGKSKDDQIRALRALVEDSAATARPPTVFGRKPPNRAFNSQ